MILSLLHTSAASAQTTKPTDSAEDICFVYNPKTGRCGYGEDQQSTVPVVTQTNRGSSSPGTVSDGKTYIPYDKIMVGPDGQACIGTGYYESGSSVPRPVQGPTESEEGPGNSSSLYSTAPPCPRRLGPSGAASLETPAMVARRHWEDIVLPDPRPRIAPGRAITGKTAYLETVGQRSYTYSNTTVFGPLVIIATGSYWISWGDGEATGPYAVEGMPWPDGTITHEYQSVGLYDIMVTERWNASWQLGGKSGVLRGMETTGNIDDFPVQQIQAVIGR